MDVQQDIRKEQADEVEVASFYHDFEQPDPPHQGLYLTKMLALLKSANGINKILDVGCGDGNFTASLAEHSYEMYGIDRSAGGVAKARQRYPKIHFQIASAHDDFRSPFSGVRYFDAVVSVEVIEHLYSPRQFAKQCVSAVRPAGLIIVTTPYWGYVKNLALAISNRTDRALTALWEGGHIKHFSYRTLRTLFEQAGAEFISFHGCGRGIPGLWNGMLMAFRKP